jgi:hypothetical protein
MRTVFFVAMLLASFVAHASQNIPSVNEYVYQLKQTAQRDGNSIEIGDIITTDMNNDGKLDVVVMYAVLGATWQTIHITVFVDNNQRFFNKMVMVDNVQLIAAEARHFQVNKGIISVDLTQWADNDPHCCPTIHTKARFKLRDKKIVDY